MGINGDNNRVAGRDYYEQNTFLKLTPEQLMQVAIKPCARCEDRVVSADVSICNHCRHELQTEARNERLLRYGFAIMVVWGVLLQWLNGRAPGFPPVSFFELGAIATLIVILGAAAWSAFQKWWLLNGAEALSLAGKLILRLIKGSKQ
ncbi:MULTISPECIES: hypothetical protein [Pseudomonas]